MAIPSVVVLRRGDRDLAVVDFADSMSAGRSIASFWRRHHLVGEGVEIVVVRRDEWVADRS